MELYTERLTLRQWQDTDREPFSNLNLDPQVMEFFPAVISRQASNDFVDEQIENIAQRGWGIWASEITATGDFIGFVGLSSPPDWHPCSGNVEIGWRLATEYWGRGFATEAAAAVLRAGFETAGLDEIISFTSACNHRSRAVMCRLKMAKQTVGFDHPRISEASKLRRHVVYRLQKAQWLVDGADN